MAEDKELRFTGAPHSFFFFHLWKFLDVFSLRFRISDFHVRQEIMTFNALWRSLVFQRIHSTKESCFPSVSRVSKVGKEWEIWAPLENNKE